MSSSPATAAESLRSAEELARAERSARLFWVSLIVGLLGTQVVIGFASIYLSLGDPTVAVIPNYHQSALDWDVKHRAMTTLQKLDWEIAANVEPADASGLRPIILQIEDSAGEPVSGLHVEASVFHHARGSDIEKMHFVETEEHAYTAKTHITAKGVWQFDIRLESDAGIAGKTIELGVN